jgi:two-component system chemotaxis response regulator CheB
MIRTPIRLLVVDDSALARKIITSSLAPYPEIEVVGTAVDPYIARDKILDLNPDVITLDIEMPRMDGITFLKLIMKHKPRPVIIMSSLTPAGSVRALEALQAGAVDVMDKPSGSFSAHASGAQLAEKIKAAARARMRPQTVESRDPNQAPRRIPTAPGAGGKLDARSLILLGASTGGTEALKTVLTSMRGDLPCICVVQHIPGYFSKAFADRLNQLCQMEVREASHGIRSQPGLALVAPGGFHMVLEWDGASYKVKLNEGPPLHHQRPAVDILFDSAVKAGAAPFSSAALLTGMGVDGARGLLHLRQAGAQTIAQNEESCVVYGMPREAVSLDAAQQILPLDQIGPRLQEVAIDNITRRPAALALHSEV